MTATLVRCSHGYPRNGQCERCYPPETETERSIASSPGGWLHTRPTLAASMALDYGLWLQAKKEASKS